LAARPQALYQYCRFVNFKGTDKDHFTSGGVDNVTRLLKVENLPNRRFGFTLGAPFPEGIAPGRVSPVRKMIVAETTHEPSGTNLPLQGNNWNYELDTAIDALTYEGVVQDLGDERWSADTRLVPREGDTSTGGRAWLCKTVAGQHSDSMFQIEDGRPVGHLRIENCVTSGNYQVPGIIGSPGSPFTFRNLHAFKIFAAPQDPATQGVYVKGSESGHFEGCCFEMPFGRRRGRGARRGFRRRLQPAPSPAGVRLHAGGREQVPRADGRDGRRSDRLHGHGHAHRGALAAQPAALRLFQAKLRPGQPIRRSTRSARNW
jgi:hypothetical protein